VTFGDRLTYSGEDETVRLIHTPGHSADSVVAYLDEAAVLFAGDTLERPLPNFAQRDGREARVRTPRQLKQLPAGTIVPSHGPATGKELIDRNERYIDGVHGAVADLKGRGAERHELGVPVKDLVGPGVEIGAVYRTVHRENLEWAYDEV